jgi:hypothetical protein
MEVSLHADLMSPFLGQEYQTTSFSDDRRHSIGRTANEVGVAADSQATDSLKSALTMLPASRLLVLPVRSIGICVRHVCRDTSWAPVSVINPQSTARYSSQVPASRDGNPPVLNQQIDCQPDMLDANTIKPWPCNGF